MRRILFVMVLLGCEPKDPTPEDTSSECVVGFADRDGDGFGSPMLRTSSCDEDVVPDNTDCDDNDFYVHPGAEERCDTVDNDCDGLIDADDDSLTGAQHFVDADEDGFGTGDPVFECSDLSGYADNADDCDDGDSARNPHAAEICDGVDNNCDDEIDEDDDDFDYLSAPLFYLDGDDDGFGGPVEIYACVQPAHTTANADDCDDTRAEIYPGAPETCSGLDNDCDGQPDATPTEHGQCPSFEGLWAGPFSLTLTHGGEVHVCAGRAHGTVDYALSSGFTGTYACDFHTTAGWAATLTGPIQSQIGLDGELVGTLDAFAGVSHDWSGLTTPDTLEGSGDALYVHSGTAWEESFSFQLALPTP